jgi:hypothetical protein
MAGGLTASEHPLVSAGLYNKIDSTVVIRHDAGIAVSCIFTLLKDAGGCAMDAVMDTLCAVEPVARSQSKETKRLMLVGLFQAAAANDTAIVDSELNSSSCQHCNSLHCSYAVCLHPLHQYSCTHSGRLSMLPAYTWQLLI